MTSDRNLQASREGSKWRIYGTQKTWQYAMYILSATNQLPTTHSKSQTLFFTDNISIFIYKHSQSSISDNSSNLHRTERPLYWKPTGPNPLNHGDDFGGPTLRNGSWNLHFPPAPTTDYWSLTSGFIQEVSPLLSNPCHFKDYDRPVFPLILLPPPTARPIPLLTDNISTFFHRHSQSSLADNLSPFTSSCKPEGLSTKSLRKVDIYGYLEKGIQTPMAQDRSTKVISMIKWIRTSRLSEKNSLSLCSPA